MKLIEMKINNKNYISKKKLLMMILKENRIFMKQMEIKIQGENPII